MRTEYRFGGINPREPSLMISVGVSRKYVEIPLSELELIHIISRIAIALENMRKERER